MSERDPLIWELNQDGYQAVWLAETGLLPPDVYVLERTSAGHRLHRRGGLAHYLPAVTALPVARGHKPDIKHHRTSQKKYTGVLAILRHVLSFGLGAKLDVASSSDLTFQFTDVTYARVEVASLDPLLPQLQLPSLSDRDISDNRIHIVYEYLYATKILVTRADRKAFDGDVKAKLPEMAELTQRANISVDNSTELTLSLPEPIAFAYKAGQLYRESNHWRLGLTATARGSDTRAPYLPAEDEVLEPT